MFERRSAEVRVFLRLEVRIDLFGSSYPHIPENSSLSFLFHAILQYDLTDMQLLFEFGEIKSRCSGQFLRQARDKLFRL